MFKPSRISAEIEDIYRGGNSKPRNPRMQTMLRMIGFGDNAGSGFPAILSTWKNQGWVMPDLKEDTRLNQVTLTLKMVDALKKSAEKSSEKSAEKSAEKSSNNKVGREGLSKRQKQILACMKQGKSNSTEEVVQMISSKGSRTRQLLNELVAMDLVSCTAATKNRRYIKE